MIRCAITEYRETPSINRLNGEKVNAAIDRVYERVHEDVSDFFNKEIAQHSLVATSNTAMALGSALTAFPLVGIFLDAAALVTFATAMGLQIDLTARSTKVVAEANGLKALVDKEPELAPAKKWNDARQQEFLILSRLNIGMQDYRADSCLYALIFVIDQQTPGLNDEQLFDAIKRLCMNVSGLAGKVPTLGNKLYEVVSKEDPNEITEAIQAIARMAPEVLGEVIGYVGGTIGLGLRFVFTTDFKSVQKSWTALRGGPIPNDMESKWARTLTGKQKLSAGTSVLFNTLSLGYSVFKAVETAEQRDEVLATIATNRDAVKEFYKAILSHVH